MAIQLEQVFSAGGRPLIELLSHCAFSINTDALFLYLVREFRFRPEASAAIALHDVFCATNSPACIHDKSLIAPRDWRLSSEIEPLRNAVTAAPGTGKQEIDSPVEESAIEEESRPQAMEDESDGPEETPPPPLPSVLLFDRLATSIRAGMRVRELESYYDLSLDATENLPGGELSVAQRAFVDHAWAPMIRPFLVSAGFWRIATIG